MQKCVIVFFAATAVPENIVTWNGDICVVYDTCITEGLCRHMTAFLIRMPSTQNYKRILKLDPNELIIPRSVHVAADGTYMVSMVNI